MIFNRYARGGGGGGLGALIYVTVEAGSTVTATMGAMTRNAVYSQGVYVIDVPAFGDWVVTATKGANTATATVSVTKAGMYEVTLKYISATLNDNDWATIRDIADASEGANYWSVGDTKQITINGKLSNGLTLTNYQTWVYIIGFDHNKDVEGTGIAFQGFKTAQTGGIDVALCDSGYNSARTSGQWFNMNNEQVNTGGWASSHMRTTAIPVVETALPVELTSVIKTTTIYSDNKGGNPSYTSYVTATQDMLYILAEFEVFGVKTYANVAEQNYQQQYAYYSAGNSKIKYRHNSTSATASWLERSVYASSSYFCYVDDNGATKFSNATVSRGLAPAFKVGGAKYTPVEYISSSGTQYINTGYIPTPNTRVVLDAEVTSQTAASCSYFGERDKGGGADDITAYEIWSMGTAANVSSDFFGNRVSYTINTKQRLLIDKNKATVTVNGNTVTNSAAAGTTTIPMYIFASNDSGVASYFINMKLYSCKIYENDVLVRDFIPAKDEWGNAGLWDDVEGKFYYNAGTGVFGRPGTRRIGAVGVGQSVYCSVNNAKTEFIIVNQGTPSSLYDSSCDGTWLLMNNIYENRQWHSSNVNKYESSDIYSYLDGTFLNLLDSGIQDIIKQVKIPYRKGGGSGGSNQSGTNGLSCRVFLLSGYEVGWTTSDQQYFPQDGAKLSYFESGIGASANDRRVANLSSSASSWWLRSPYTDDTTGAWRVYSDGSYDVIGALSSSGVRPAFIIPSDTYIDEDDNILTAPPYNAISTLNVGDSVFCKENGVSAEYLLVHKGNPDASIYDTSCDGAWLLRKDILSLYSWDSAYNAVYSDSDINKYLNTTVSNVLSAYDSVIAQCKIPYVNGYGGHAGISSGESGLSAKFFVLSPVEMNYYAATLYYDGAVLSYFEDGAYDKRKAEYNGSAQDWWTRSPRKSSDGGTWYVTQNGGVNDTQATMNNEGIRPCFIVPLDTFIDSSNNIIA